MCIRDSSICDLLNSSSSLESIKITSLSNIDFAIFKLIRVGSNNIVSFESKESAVEKPPDIIFLFAIIGNEFEGRIKLKKKETKKEIKIIIND